MEKLKIGSKTYDVKFTVLDSTKVAVLFMDAVPLNPAAEEISLVDSSGSAYATYTGYNTVYQKTGNSVILSNDGTTYEEPEPQEPDIAALMESERQNKLSLMSYYCEQTIYNGVDVALAGGTEHFSLTEKDQLNLFGKQMQLAGGADKLEYHEDGNPCKYYAAADMQKIIEAAMAFVSYNTTYCNALNMWIKGAATLEEVRSIQWGVGIPAEYQNEVLKDYLARGVQA